MQIKKCRTVSLAKLYTKNTEGPRKRIKVIPLWQEVAWGGWWCDLAGMAGEQEIIKQFWFKMTRNEGGSTPAAW